MDTERVERLLAFLELADRMKSVERAAGLADGSRRESDAEHTWHALLFAFLLDPDPGDPVQAQARDLLLVHDLVEIHAGDTWAHSEDAQRGKAAREAAAAARLAALLPVDAGSRLLGLLAEYAAGESAAARLAHGLDRLQGLAQNVFAQGRLWRERDVSEARSRAYNASAMRIPALAPYFEALYRRAAAEGMWPAGGDAD